MASFSASVILIEERNSLMVDWVGLARGMPPNLAGRAKRSALFHLVVVCL